jgi:nucleoid-associated protein YgaU
MNMNLYDFVKDVGKKLTQVSPMAIVTPEQLAKEVEHQGLKVEGLTLSVVDATVTVVGKVSSQEIREKVVLTLGNVNGVARVEDRLMVDVPQPESVFHTVQKGETLSKIAKVHYGNAGKYPVIFEANKPMLSDPDKIYPGQVLRIPKV